MHDLVAPVHVLYLISLSGRTTPAPDSITGRLCLCTTGARIRRARGYWRCTTTRTQSGLRNKGTTYNKRLLLPRTNLPNGFHRFSRWSLHLYGIHVDYNKEEDDSTSSHRLNVMREAVIKTSTPSTTTTTTTTTTTSTPEVLDRGCASKQRTCTKVVSHCRTFNYRQVAEIFCRCMDICLEVAAVTMDQSGEQIFNLQCDMGKKNNSDTAKKEISGPIYCNFFIF